MIRVVLSQHHARADKPMYSNAFKTVEECNEEIDKIETSNAWLRDEIEKRRVVLERNKILALQIMRRRDAIREPRA